MMPVALHQSVVSTETKRSGEICCLPTAAMTSTRTHASFLSVIPEGDLLSCRPRRNVVISTEDAAVVERPLYFARSANNAH